MPKVLAEKYIGPEIELDKEEKKHIKIYWKKKSVSSDKRFVIYDGKNNSMEYTWSIPTKSTQTP